MPVLLFFTWGSLAPSLYFSFLVWRQGRQSLFQDLDRRMMVPGLGGLAARIAGGVLDVQNGRNPGRGFPGRHDLDYQGFYWVPYVRSSDHRRLLVWGPEWDVKERYESYYSKYSRFVKNRYAFTETSKILFASIAIFTSGSMEIVTYASNVS